MSNVWYAHAIGSGIIAVLYLLAFLWARIQLKGSKGGDKGATS